MSARRAEPLRAGRTAATALTAGLLGAAAFPFVVLFPDPPGFGPETLILLATFGIVATAAMAWRADWLARPRILHRAALLFAITAATMLTGVALRGELLLPILDLLPGMFGLDGETAETALFFELWCEWWLVWAVLLGLPALWLLRRREARSPPRGPWDGPPPPPPWNGATRLLFAVGWCAMAATVIEGHRTAEFLRGATRTTGTIASDEGHPLVRFAMADGATVTFRQNGGLSRAVGDGVPVAYDASDPAGTARADTFSANWGNTAGLTWLGLGFTLFPFFGIRAAFGRR